MGGREAERPDIVAYDDYIHELPERFAAAPVVKYVEKLQEYYQRGSWDEAGLQGAWYSVQKLLEDFRSQSREQNLINQVVTIEGDGIKVPQMSIDLRSGMYMVAHEDVPEFEEETFKQYQVTHEVTGLFAGYSLAFAETSQGSKRYRAQFVYQLSTGMVVETPHGPVPLYTTGIVGQSSLRFLEDERRDTIAESANRLYELAPEARGSVHRIVEEALTKHHESDSLLRHLGYHAELIVSAAPDASKGEVEDILTRLISTTFVEQQKVTILTDEHVRQFDDDTRAREYFRSDDDVSLIDGHLKGVIFLNEEDTLQAKLNIVVGRPGEVVFVQMANILEYARE